MGDDPNPLPSYTMPPVAEVVCGFQYSTPLLVGLQQMLNIWASFSDRYPTLDEHPPLPRLSTEQDLQPQFEILQNVPYLPRLWFSRADSGDLVQFQRDRLIFNWRKTSESDQYLRFQKYVKPNMIDAHDRLVQALNLLEVEEPPIDAFEVAYVNPIPLGPDDDFSTVLRTLRPSSEGGFLSRPEGLQMQLNYPMRDVNGGLGINVQSAVRKADDVATVLVQLTVRGRVDGTYDDFVRCVGVAREWIVRGFTDMTTEEMHTRWGLES